MPDQLEEYLHQVRGQLKSLPEQVRDDEIEEVRQHLLSLIAHLKEKGLNVDEATAAALQQFGSAKKIGTDLYKAVAGPKPRLQRNIAIGAAAGACFLGFYQPLIILLCFRHMLPLGLPIFASLLILTQGAIGGAIAGCLSTYFYYQDDTLPSPLSKLTYFKLLCKKSFYFFCYGATSGLAMGSWLYLGLFLFAGGRHSSPRSASISDLVSAARGTALISFVIGCAIFLIYAVGTVVSDSLQKRMTAAK